jgi:hypothetical protein
VIPQGSAEQIAEVVSAHLDAGADHVCLQPLGQQGIPRDFWMALAKALGDQMQVPTSSGGSSRKGRAWTSRGRRGSSFDVVRAGPGVPRAGDRSSALDAVGARRLSVESRSYVKSCEC